MVLPSEIVSIASTVSGLDAIVSLLSAEHFSGGSETFRNTLKELEIRARWMKQREVSAKAALGYCPLTDGLCAEKTTPVRT